MKLRLCFLLFLFPLCCWSQLKISGKVVDEETQKGIAGVSVYVDLTSYGTQTNAEGRFEFDIPLEGKVSLVFSHLGYSKKIEMIERQSVSDLVISLKPKNNDLAEIVIKAQKYSPKNVTKWIQLFSYNLIGVYNGLQRFCKIKNPEALYFDFDEGANLLKVYAKEALLIENTYLDYEIRVDLEQFEYNFRTNEILFNYTSLYKKLAKLNIGQVRKNRLTVYKGSSMHFMRSLYADGFEEDGFYLYQYKELRNKEKDRVNAMIRQKIVTSDAKIELPITKLSLFFSRDTANYYEDIQKQKDVLSSSTVPVSARKFSVLNKADQTANFDFPDTLLISYNKMHAEMSKQVAALAKQNKDNINFVKPVFLSTYIYLFKKEGGINIQSNGYYPEQRLFMYGDMAERRMAASLPFDFDPKRP